MDRRRIRRLKTALRRARLDAMILRLPENVVMSFGVWPMAGFAYGVFTADAGPVALIAPSSEDREMDDCWAGEVRFFDWPRTGGTDALDAIAGQVRDLAREHRLARASIGYEGSFERIAPPHNAAEPVVACESSVAYLKSILPRARWVDATGLLFDQRAIKTECEIGRLRTANRVAAFGLKAFHRSVTVGASEAELAATVHGECLIKGSRLPGVRHVNAYPQIASGPNAHRAWRPIVATGKRRLKNGEVALVELAVCVDGFWADVTRVKVAGRPSAIQKDVFAAVSAACAAAVACIRPGVKASRPDAAARGALIDAGFEDYIEDETGHGLGFSYHEPQPLLIEGNDEVTLRKGHVCSVEPGLYDRKWGGIRLEDNVAVTADGVEILTQAPRVL